MPKGPKYDWFLTENQNREEWERLCPVNEYRIVMSRNLPGVIPKALRDQYNSVFIMASGTSSGAAYYMANGNRVDFADNAIDQMPFGLGFVGVEPIASGCLIQHGNWSDRTIHPPNDFWNQINVSGIASYYPLSILPTSISGSIYELEIKTQADAFQRLVEVLRGQVED